MLLIRACLNWGKCTNNADVTFMSLPGFVEDAEAVSVRLCLVFPLHQAVGVTLIWHTMVVAVESNSVRTCVLMAQAYFFGVFQLKAQIELRQSGMSRSTRALRSASCISHPLTGAG